MKGLSIFLASLWLVIMPHHVSASSLDASTKAQLQTTMITFLEKAADETGAFGVIDRETGFRVAVFPGQSIRALCRMGRIISYVSKCLIKPIVR